MSTETKLSPWVALRELRFDVKGQQVVVAQGQRVPVACWEATEARRISAIVDPHARLVTRSAHD